MSSLSSKEINSLIIIPSSFFTFNDYINNFKPKSRIILEKFASAQEMVELQESCPIILLIPMHV